MPEVKKYANLMDIYYIFTFFVVLVMLTSQPLKCNLKFKNSAFREIRAQCFVTT